MLLQFHPTICSSKSDSLGLRLVQGRLNGSRVRVSEFILRAGDGSQGSILAPARGFPKENTPCHLPALRRVVILPGFRGDGRMDTNAIIGELEHERDRLDQAIRALAAGGGAGKRRGRRRLSTAAKKRISDAMRRTWAERKRKGKAA
jgi:exonuclease VII small subunit